MVLVKRELRGKRIDHHLSAEEEIWRNCDGIWLENLVLFERLSEVKWLFGGEGKIS